MLPAATRDWTGKAFCIMSVAMQHACILSETQAEISNEQVRKVIQSANEMPGYAS